MANPVGRTALPVALLWLAVRVAAGEEATPPASAPRCEVAVVNPVSGFAECVKPAACRWRRRHGDRAHGEECVDTKTSKCRLCPALHAGIAAPGR